MDDFPDIEEICSRFIKKGSKFGFWHNRFCVLQVKEMRMILYLTRDRKIVDRIIRITPDIEVDLEEHRKHPSFTIHGNNERPCRLSCEDVGELCMWVNTIRMLAITSQQLSMKDFRPIAVIGRGYYGKVTLCEKRNTGQLFAIKSVHKSRLMKAHKVTTVINERNVLMNSDHPFIVHIYFAFQSTSKVFMGFEYVAGGDMAFHLNNLHKFDVYDVRLYVAELALALDYIHKMNIIYRDLKPENILIDEQGCIKLTDFGLVKNIQYSLGAKSFCGTPAYIAPEIIQSKKYGPKIDWWALGICMYTFLYGVPPWNYENMDKLFDAIINEPLEFPQGATDDQRDLISALLDKNPETRKDIKYLVHHPFFDGIRFKDVLNKTIQHKFKPEIKEITRPQNFEKEYLDETALESMATPIKEDAFAGFSFIANSDGNVPDNDEEYNFESNLYFAPSNLDNI